MSFLDKIFGSFTSGNESYDELLKRGDYAGAVPLLKAAVRQDDERAMGLMATLTAFGRGVEKDAEEACCWFRQAAVRGHVVSQAALGICLATGAGTRVDRDEAAYWLFRAGKAGNRQAIEALGAIAFEDHSIVGKHFTEEELCRLVVRLRKPLANRQAVQEEKGGRHDRSCC